MKNLIFFSFKAQLNDTKQTGGYNESCHYPKIYLKNSRSTPTEKDKHIRNFLNNLVGNLYEVKSWVF